MTVIVSFVEDLSKETQSILEKGLEEYELSHGIHVDFTPFAFELRNEKELLSNVVYGIRRSISCLVESYL